VFILSQFKHTEKPCFIGFLSDREASKGLVSYYYPREDDESASINEISLADNRSNPGAFALDVGNPAVKGRLTGH